MTDLNDGLDGGAYGRRRKAPKIACSSKQVGCVMTYGGEGSHSHTSLTSLSLCTLPILCLASVKNKGVKWIRHVWEGESHIWETLWLYWLNSTRLIPQRPGQSFCGGLRESISGITSPIDKNTHNELLPTLCMKQRSFHWGTSLSCSWMLLAQLYLKWAS